MLRASPSACCSPPSPARTTRADPTDPARRRPATIGWSGPTSSIARARPTPAWSYDVGGHGWGNNELQFYTDNRRENARVEGGHLVIEARREAWEGRATRRRV